MKQLAGKLMKGLRRYIARISGVDKVMREMKMQGDKQKILLGKLLADRNAEKKTIGHLGEVEFSVFSQVGDDGIIQWLLNIIPFPEQSKTFIEFGVENYTEATTRFLLINNNWSGLVLDGSPKNVEYIKNDPISWMFDLKSEALFVTRSNINEAIRRNGFEGEIGILHIDIDGNDYWIWDAIDVIQPILVIIEYNSVFGPDKAITVPYQDDFVAESYHYSRIVFGASLKALLNICERKGYNFIGSNSSGQNCYFVKKEYDNEILKNIDKSYIKSKFNQARNINGNLSGDNDHKVYSTVKDINLYDVELGKIVKL